MTGRYVTDGDTETALVFPDLLRVSIVSEDVDKDESIISIDLELIADPDELAKFPKSREISLGDTFFVLRRPKHAGIIDFQFLPTGGLAARVVVVAKTSMSTEIKALATSDPKFFDPEYSGSTEVYTSEVELAKVLLPEMDVELVRTKKGLASQVLSLGKAVSKHISDSDHRFALRLADAIIDEQGKVEKLGSAWHLTLPPGGISFRITEQKEVVSRIGGDSDNVRIS